MSEYKKMILHYITLAEKDLAMAETEQEEVMSAYLIYELKSIINDVEKQETRGNKR